MPAKPKVPHSINVLIGLGIVGYLALIIALVYFVRVFVFSPLHHDDAPPLNEVIGELGSQCGGPRRLPCRPGLMCSHGADKWLQDGGVCMLDPAADPLHVPGALGEDCNLEKGCGGGLVCETFATSTSGICQAVATSTKPTR